MLQKHYNNIFFWQYILKSFQISTIYFIIILSYYRLKLIILKLKICILFGFKNKKGIYNKDEKQNCKNDNDFKFNNYFDISI